MCLTDMWYRLRVYAFLSFFVLAIRTRTWNAPAVPLVKVQNSELCTSWDSGRYLFASARDIHWRSYFDNRERARPAATRFKNKKSNRPVLCSEVVNEVRLYKERKKIRKKKVPQNYLNCTSHVYLEFLFLQHLFRYKIDVIQVQTHFFYYYRLNIYVKTFL